MNYQNFYERGNYRKLHPNWHLEDASWKSEAITTILEAHPLRLSTIGDVGCGAGGILFHLQKKLPKTTHFYGYDISPDAIRLSRQWENENLKFYNTDLFTLDNTTFDLLLCIDVFEHVDDYIGFLQKLRPFGKYTLFHIPLDLSVNSILRPAVLRRRRDVSGHLHYFTKETAIRTLHDAGYNGIGHMYTSSNQFWVRANRERLSRSVKIQSYAISFIRNVIFKLNADFAVRVLGGYSLLILTE